MHAFQRTYLKRVLARQIRAILADRVNKPNLLQVAEPAARCIEAIPTQVEHEKLAAACPVARITDTTDRDHPPALVPAQGVIDE